MWPSLPGMLLTPECVFLHSVVSCLGCRIPRRVAKLWVRAMLSALCKGVMSVSESLPPRPQTHHRHQTDHQKPLLGNAAPQGATACQT